MASPTTSNAVDKEANGVGIHDADTPSDGELRASDTVEWTPEEERKLVRRLDFVVMPILMLGFFVLQLDRNNIGNALTDFFLEEVGISQFQFNIGKQLMYLGIVLFEIPSNLILYRVGPPVWIGFQIVAWGLVATFQAFIKGKGVGPFLATRFLLGVCECGYIPAGMYCITRFYKTEETSKRFALFFLGNMSTNGAVGLIAYGILHMRDVAGLSGWQWLFLIEGALTLVVAACFIIVFPRSTDRPVSLFGLRYFDQREAQILTQRVLRDDPTKIHAKPHVSREEFKAAMTNWRLLAHMATTICGLAASSALFSFAPSIVASYGYGRLRSNAMVSIGHWMVMLVTLAWGWISDTWGRRGPMVFIGISISWVFVITNRLIVDSDNFQAKFAILTLIIAFSFNWHPIHGSWVALNTKTAGEWSVTMAIYVMSANISGIASGQIFQEHDKPRYQTAWSVTVALSCLAVTFSALANFQYWYLNRRNAKNGGAKYVYKP